MKENSPPPTIMPPMDGWIIDSGASSHMTSQKEYLSQYRQFETPEKVGLIMEELLMQLVLEQYT